MSLKQQATTNWTGKGRIPFQVRIGQSFSSMNEALKYAVGADSETLAARNEQNTSNVDANIFNDYFTDFVESFSEDTSFWEPGSGHEDNTKRFYKDTRLGANDVVNTLWQFNRDDDIIPELFLNKNNCGFGRVYGTTIYQNQSAAYFTFGVPIFCNLVEFYRKAFDTNLIEVNAIGYTKDTKYIELLTQGILSLVTIPLMPFKWLWNFMNKGQEYAVNKFYDLRGNMPQYYKYIDSMINAWLIDTGIMTSSDGPNNTHTVSGDHLPDLVNLIGTNMWTILCRKANVAYNASPDNKEYEDTYKKHADDLIKTHNQEYRLQDEKIGSNIFGTLFTDFLNIFKQTALGASQFIGFRIEKSVDANESWSNSTVPNSIAEKINSKLSEMHESAASKGGDLSGTTLNDLGKPGEILQGVLSGINEFLSGTTALFGIDNLAALALSGAYIDIPEQYKSSDFSKSHSLSFQLRSPYGDPVSIYQSIMVPLFCLLAGVMPRGAGLHSYMQPFLCRVYCKGLFSIPLGIIDSLSVKRGSSEFGWTYANLPTCVDVNVSIKDLSPAMYMGMADNTLENPFGTNNNFDEYLLTLAGLGLFDRISRWQRIKRRVSRSLNNVINRTLNPVAWAHTAGSSVLPTFFGSFLSGVEDIGNR